MLGSLTFDKGPQESGRFDRNIILMLLFTDNYIDYSLFALS